MSDQDEPPRRAVFAGALGFATLALASCAPRRAAAEPKGATSDRGRSLTNLDELRGLDDPKDGERRWVDGFGEFRFSATSNATPNESFVVSRQAGAGRWLLELPVDERRGWFDVMHYGAVPDGIADASPAVQAALDAARANGGGIVYFPPGHYRLVRGVVLRGAHEPPNHSGISLVGAGAHYSRGARLMGSWLIWGSAGSGALLEMRGLQDVSVEGLGFFGTPSGTAAEVVGIRIVSDNQPASFGLAFRRITVAFCDVGIDWGDGLNEHQTDHVAIEQFAILSCRTAGIRVRGGNAADYSLVQGGRFQDNHVALDLAIVGSVRISCCAAGGAKDATFIRATGFYDTLTIDNCQAEGMAAFLDVVPSEGTSNDAQQIVLTGNTIDVPVKIRGITRVVALGNYVNADIELAPGARWMAFGDRVRGDHGSRVARAPGASYVNLLAPLASPIGDYHVEGELILGTDVDAGPRLVTRSGVVGLPAREGAHYRVGDFVAAPNGQAYRVTRANTGLLEHVRNWPLRGTLATTDYDFEHVGPAAELANMSVVRTGHGSPEGVVSARVGTLYTRVDGGAGSTLYVKESGDGPFGWRAK